MSIESLANELLLDIFEYFHAIPLILSFHHLNKRIDNLILKHFRKHRFDFRRCSKRDFDKICQSSVASFTNSIYSLGLSDGDETPHLISLFRMYGFTLNRFSNLRSILFDHIRCGEMISDFLLECPNLIHINLTGCYFGSKQSDVQHLLNTIWNLSKLRSCYLNIDFKYGFTLPLPNPISLSIEELSVIGVPFHFNQFNYLCELTPNLRYVALDFHSSLHNETLQTDVLSIEELNIVVISVEQRLIENLLAHVPNLTKLKIETCYVEMNGHEWEHIIDQFLPKLENFQFKMRFTVHSEKDRLDLLKSFQTRFWINKHQWFVRHHYNSSDYVNMICLYTLPYGFSNIDIHFPILLQSTDEDDNNYRSYESVRHLFYRSSLVDQTAICELYFPNVDYLSVTFPFNDHLLSIITTFNRLISLEISKSNRVSNTEAQLQLQTLLDCTPKLYSLKFNSWSGFSSPNENFLLKMIENRKIQRLDLLGLNFYFSSRECHRLCSSLFAEQCQTLFIQVEQRETIIDIIHQMKQLQALIVRSKDDSWINRSSSNDDQFVIWLRQNLPSTCSINRDSRYVHHIRIWVLNSNV